MRRLLIIPAVLATIVLTGILANYNPQSTQIQGASNPLALVSTTTHRQESGTTATLNHNSSGTNTLLVVAVSYMAGNDSTNVKSILHGTVGKAIKVRRDRADTFVNEIWYLVNPLSGTQPVKVTFNGKPTATTVAAMTFAGVEQTNPIQAEGGATPKIVGAGNKLVSGSNNKTPSVNVPSAPDDLVFAVVTTSSRRNTLTPSSNLKTAFNISTTEPIFTGAAAPATGNMTTISWKADSTANHYWVVSGISIKPAKLTVENMPVRVLAVGYNPIENGKTIADIHFQHRLNGKTADQLEDSVFNKTKEAFKELSNGTIQYNIVKKIHVRNFQPYPNGFTFNATNYANCVYGSPQFKPTECENRKKTFNYNKWLNDNKICEEAKAVNADEIWVLALPYVMNYESYMVGPTAGFYINGPAMVNAKCHKNMAVMHGTYDYDDSILHVFGHRFESTMKYLTATWKAADRTAYWGSFAAMGIYDASYPTKPVCGNAHFTSNSGKKQYDYANTQEKVSTCPDLANFPYQNGSTLTVTCAAWGCKDSSWNKYWMSFVPRQPGEVKMVSSSGKAFTFARNWWKYWLYPEEAIAQRKRM